MQQAPERRYQTTQEMKTDVVAVRNAALPDAENPAPAAVVTPPATQVPPYSPPDPPKKQAALSPPTAPAPSAQREPSSDKPPVSQSTTQIDSHRKPPTPETVVMQAIPLPAPRKSKLPRFVGVTAALLLALVVLVHFAPWKKGDATPGGTRSVVPQTSAGGGGKLAVGKEAAPSNVATPAANTPAKFARPPTKEWVVYDGKAGAGFGKHVVLISGDDEYRSEESLPMLAKILSERHGFKCTVLFAVDKDGFINPTVTNNLPGAEALDSADAIIMLIRWRAWPDEQMKHFVDAYLRGVPIIGLRTATHPFKPDPNSSYKQFANFGKTVLGEGWVNHWGAKMKEGTRGVVEPIAKDDPILHGLGAVFGPREVYEAYPPSDARVLLRGQVLTGANADDPPAQYKKHRTTDGVEQGINDPMMPIAWTREHQNEAGRRNKYFCTTMGAAGDFKDEGVRRLIVNSVYSLLGLPVPAKADVNYVGDYRPSVDAAKRGVKPTDLAVQVSVNEPTTIENVLTKAKKDAPFVNTLGMKFVPVPVSGGPTAGNACYSACGTPGCRTTPIITRTHRVERRRTMHGRSSMYSDNYNSPVATVIFAPSRSFRFCAARGKTIPAENSWRKILSERKRK